MAYQVSLDDRQIPDNIDALMHDSRQNQDSLEQILSLLKPDKIKDFSYLRISDQGYGWFAGTYDKEYLVKYVSSGNWLDQSLYNPYAISNYRVIDYSAEVDYEASEQYQSYAEDELSIIFDRRYHNYKDIFCFVIDKQYYNQLKMNDILKFHERINAVADLCYSLIKLETIIHLPRYFKQGGGGKLSAGDKAILSYYQLTQSQVAYLRYIATGYTAKEIAQHMDKSYRSVQDIIHKLCEKFGLQTKTQLAHVAKVIFSYFK